jgi:rhomboid family GlyGly-CTERM serine protease
LISAPGSAWWCGVAALLAVGALLAHGRLTEVIDWQPALVLAHPWRWWSAAWVHYSNLHLAANLAGALLVALLGVAAQVSARVAIAWLLAWPLTHLGLLIEPNLAHFGGLSGVLHAGVAVIVLQLVIEGPRRRRWLGLALAAGLLIKVISEAPWSGPVQHPPGWDIGIAPLAHACGVVAGALAGALLIGLPRARATMARHD